MIRTRTVPSPLGDLLIVGEDPAVSGLYFEPHPAIATDGPGRFEDAVTQLAEWFEGRRRGFDLALTPRGTEFQLRVWRALAAIPYGRTTTYRAVAVRAARPSAARPAGQAIGRNPIAIVIPCHRVVGADGGLTGYGGGLDRKIWLLEHEARVGPAGEEPAGPLPVL